MVEHIVLFQWKDTATPKQIEAVMTGLKGLKDKIPGIVDLSCGKNFTDRSRGFEYGLVVRFRDREALDAYQPHPEHQKVVQNFIQPILAGILAVDYDIL